MSVIVMWNWQEGGNGFSTCGNHMAVESAILRATNDPSIHAPSIEVRHIKDYKVPYLITQTMVTNVQVNFDLVKEMF